MASAVSSLPSPASGPQAGAGQDQATTPKNTDLGNGMRLVAAHGQDIHWVEAWAWWLTWDGTRWSRDNTGAVMRLAIATARAMLREAGLLLLQADDPQLTDDQREKLRDQAESLSKWALQSQNVRRLQAMVELAKSLPGVAVVPSQLDANPWLLNCINGTLNLLVGKLQQHNRDDLITKLAPVNYDPTARYAAWEQFLERVLPDDEFRAFVQRASGYTLTGDASEECLFFPFGDTNTGKSTFLRALASVMGDYSTTADFDTFLEHPSIGGHNEPIARLAGRRMVISIEVEEGKKLAESLVKSVTGRDEQTASFKYGHSFSYFPQFKLWFAANNRPRVAYGSNAMWRRIHQLPFSVVIPEEERDPGLKTALCNSEVAGPAILAWAVQGCLAWQRDGLDVPQVVRDATRDYRQSQDPIADFLDDRCLLAPEARVDNSVLWNAYSNWAKNSNVRRPLGHKVFTQRVQALSGVVQHREGTRYWVGICLQAQL